MGALPTRGALYFLGGAAVIGMLGTLLDGSEPGSLLGLFIIAGSVVAVLGIRRRAMYKLIPLPTLLLFVTCVLTGAIHDRGTDSSGSALGVNFTTWISNVFFAMCVATILVIMISGGRWLLSLALVSGQFGETAGRNDERGRRTTAAPGQPGARADRGRRVGGDSLDSDPWGAADPWDVSNSSGGQRAGRGQGERRDPWDDSRPPGDWSRPDRGQSRRQPGDRGHPGDQAPGTQPGGQQPGGQPGGQQSGGQPDDRGYPGSPRPGGRPSDRGYPGGQRSGADRRPGEAVPPGRDQPGRLDQPDDRDLWGNHGQRGNRDGRDSADPWGQRLPGERG